MTSTDPAGPACAEQLARYCVNPAWASCPHRLACLKCRMYLGGAETELLEAREGVMRFQTQVPTTPEEQAVV